AVLALEPPQFVLDSEIVIPVGGGVSFDDLLMRIHPAASRIHRLSTETPGMLIVFDILVDGGGRSVVNLQLKERRKILEKFAEKYFEPEGRIRLSPATTDFATVKK